MAISTDRATALIACAAALALAATTPTQDHGDGDAPDAAQMGEPARGAGWRWIEGWGQRDDQQLGSTHGCVVVDRQGRILVNTDTEAAVVVFSPDGERLESFGAEFRGGLHGMTLRQEGDEEFLYLAHTARHEALKMTLQGEVLWTLGVPEQAGIYESERQYKPTAIALAPDGRIFVADGYGQSWVHVYDAERDYVKSFGGRGDGPGQMKTPHGLWLDERGEQPTLLVCDRENHRLQWFTLDGEFVREVGDGLRRPCNVCPLRGPGQQGWLAVADLTGCVTILDADDEVVTVLGDNAPQGQRATNRVAADQWVPGRFFAPHGVAADSSGALYVMDWSAVGRVSKLELLARSER